MKYFLNFNALFAIIVIILKIVRIDAVNTDDMNDDFIYYPWIETPKRIIKNHKSQIAIDAPPPWDGINQRNLPKSESRMKSERAEQEKTTVWPFLKETVIDNNVSIEDPYTIPPPPPPISPDYIHNDENENHENLEKHSFNHAQFKKETQLPFKFTKPIDSSFHFPIPSAPLPSKPQDLSNICQNWCQNVWIHTKKIPSPSPSTLLSSNNKIEKEKKPFPLISPGHKTAKLIADFEKLKPTTIIYEPLFESKEWSIRILNVINRHFMKKETREKRNN